MRANRICLACGRPFTAHPNVPNQKYCSDVACQRARKRDWQRSRMRADPDYRENQVRAQASWQSRHPDYWRQYRGEHPNYCDRNRTLQSARNARKREPDVANMDASLPHRPVASGIYLLSRVRDASIAKMDVWRVKLTVLSSQAMHPA